MLPLNEGKRIIWDKDSKPDPKFPGAWRQLNQGSFPSGLLFTLHTHEDTHSPKDCFCCRTPGLQVLLLLAATMAKARGEEEDATRLLALHPNYCCRAGRGMGLQQKSNEISAALTAEPKGCWLTVPTAGNKGRGTNGLKHSTCSKTWDMC